MIDTSTHTSHFVRRAGSVFDLADRINAARSLAGLKPATIAAAVTRELDKVPTVAQLRATLAEAAYDTPETDAEAWTADALDQLTRAAAAEELRVTMRAGAESALARRQGRFSTDTATDVAPAVEKTFKALTKAAAALPADGDPFDLARIIDADTTAEMKAAATALAHLAAFASIFTLRRHDKVSPKVVAVLPLVEIATVTPQAFNRLNGQGIEDGSHPERDGIRAFADDCERRGTDAALVDVARGNYPGVTFAYATASNEIHARADRAARALTLVPEPH